MRLLGKIVELGQATLLAEYLGVQGIVVTVEPETDGAAIWVRDEDHVARARQEFRRFVDNPLDPVYEAALLRARERQSEGLTVPPPAGLKAVTSGPSAAATSVASEKQAEKPVPLPAALLRSPIKRAPFTLVLIALSLLVALMITFNQDPSSPVNRGLAFWDPVHQTTEQWDRNKGWIDITGRGQIWRLITPAFLHRLSGLLAFNLFWLFFLGSLVESRHGTLRMATVVLAAAIAGNVGEFMFGQHVFFGGMSGVVFGLFGYAYVNTMMNPDSKVRIPREVIAVMIVWLVLGFSGVLEKNLQVASMNYTQLFGLLAGMVIAAFAVRNKNQQPKIA